MSHSFIIINIMTKNKGVSNENNMTKTAQNNNNSSALGDANCIFSDINLYVLLLTNN